MGRFLVRSVLERAVLLVIVSIMAHAVVHLAPGEPSEVDPSNPRMKPEDVARIREAFHLDAPLHEQYVLWVRDLATGELRSFRDNQPVLPKIWDRFLNSLPLFACATFVTWTLAFPMGLRGAVHRGRAFDRSSTFLAFVLISVPGFFFAYMAIVLCVEYLQVPVLGMRTFGNEGAGAIGRFMDGLWHVALPALIAALTGAALLSRYVRAQMLEVLGEDYIRAAHARGLPADTVVYRHGLRNALLPAITLFGLMLPGLVGGSVIIEQVFAWPGIGRLGFESILARDFPVILTLNLFAAVLTLAGTLLSDVLYALADPRIRLP